VPASSTPCTEVDRLEATDGCGSLGSGASVEI
jgi:hypothetical protein